MRSYSTMGLASKYKGCINYSDGKNDIFVSRRGIIIGTNTSQHVIKPMAIDYNLIDEVIKILNEPKITSISLRSICKNENIGNICGKDTCKDSNKIPNIDNGQIYFSGVISAPIDRKYATYLKMILEEGNTPNTRNIKVKSYISFKNYSNSKSTEVNWKNYSYMITDLRREREKIIRTVL